MPGAMLLQAWSGGNALTVVSLNVFRCDVIACLSLSFSVVAPESFVGMASGPDRRRKRKVMHHSKEDLPEFGGFCSFNRFD